MRVAVTGSSGLIGTALIDHLRQHGHEPCRVVRRAAGPDEIQWSPEDYTANSDSGRDAEQALADRLIDVDAVIHLAGAGIADHRWTDDYKQVLLSSRTKSTSLLARALARADNGPRVLLSGSAIGFYGARGSEDLDESSSPGSGFLADLVEQWEHSAEPAAEAGVRVAYLRTGIVLSAVGGALRKQLPLFKVGAGGKIGTGEQWQSWISIDDHIRAMTHLLTSDLDGPVNLTAPNAVTQADFADTLGNVLKRPTVLPIPKFGPRLVLGRELADNLLFTGQKVLPAALLGDDFTFNHPTLEPALRELLNR